MEANNTEWLYWALRIQAIAQTGLTYGKDPFDLQRYQELRQIAVDIASTHLKRSVEAVTVEFAQDSGYPTPKVDIRAVVCRDGQMLFVRETQDECWSLPGGWADIGESPSEIAEREVLEETGFEVKATKLLAVMDKARHGHPPSLTYVYKLFIWCELVGGRATTSMETDAVEWFPRSALPPLSLGRVTVPQVMRMFDHVDNPLLPTDLD
jgi:ADP-ribose pyrophosphatase YjhB (NUDIX family)